MDGLVEWMDGHYMVAHCMQKERHSVVRKGMEGKVDNLVQGHRYSSSREQRAGPFSSRNTCVPVLVPPYSLS